MVYLVTKKQRTNLPDWLKLLDYEESISLLKSWPLFQFDTETTGLDCHLDKLISLQFGYVDKEGVDTQIVVDCEDYSPTDYKDILENKPMVGMNLKFDLEFLYNYKIVPKKVCDVMICEQTLYLGYKAGLVTYNLHDIVMRRLGVEMDKSYQKLIADTGLTDEGIKYAAYDVKYLQAVMKSQAKEAQQKECVEALRLENRTVPAIAYLEWCGIHLDEKKWKEKMAKDQKRCDEALEKINQFVQSCSADGYVSDNKVVTVPPEWFSNMTYTTGLGDLFTGSFDTTLRCIIDWNSSTQVTPFLKKLGFDTSTRDKKTGEEKDSALMKKLESQKGICDAFLKPYMEYKKAKKVCTSYGQAYLNAINPITDNISTVFRQIGTDTGRLACGSTQVNVSLAKYKGLPIVKQSNTELACCYPQLQNLPHDQETRACFTAPDGYLMCSCDYSSVEQRLAADIYNDKAMIDEYLHGSGDIHSLVAQLIYPELKGLTTAQIKKEHKDLRSRAKPVGLGINYGAEATKLAETIGCSKEQAQKYYDAYMNHFTGVRDYMKKAAKEVKEKGYILICPETGHKAYWPGWGEWKAEEMKYDRAFWEDYKINHKGTGDMVAQEVRNHMKHASAWSRKAVNSPCQGLSAIITKSAMTEFFRWIVDNNLFGEVRIVDAVHDEIVITFPENMKDSVPDKLKEIMESVGNRYCKKVPIITEAEIAKYWVH